METVIGMFMVLLIPISALIPRKWLLPWTLFAAQVLTVLWIEETRAQCGSCGSAGQALGMALFFIDVLITAAVLVTRFYFVRAKEVKGLLPSGSDRPALASWALSAGGGAVALTVLWVQGWNLALNSSIATHVAVLVLAIIWFILTPLCWLNRPPLKIVFTRHPSNIFRLTGALAICGMLVWSLQVSYKVVKVAELSAHGKPYCLLVPGAHGLRPARSLIDLTGFLMQAGSTASRHAQLAKGDARAPQWNYWSYRKNEFESDAMGGVLTCTLQPNFALGLSWLSSVQSVEGDLQFWLGGGQWRIPSEYHGSSSDVPPKLRFYAQGKSFDRPTDPLVLSGPQSWNKIRQSVDVLLCTPKRLHVWHVQDDPNFKVESVGKLFGLDKQRVQKTAGGTSKYQYIEYDEIGRARTWLECGDDWLDCRHAFTRDGIVVSFMHSGQNFGEWKDLQDALWSRLKSFSVTWPNGLPAACVRY